MFGFFAEKLLTWFFFPLSFHISFELPSDRSVEGPTLRVYNMPLPSNLGKKPERNEKLTIKDLSNYESNKLVLTIK